jgi:hypothetical protein
MACLLWDLACQPLLLPRKLQTNRRSVLRVMVIGDLTLAVDADLPVIIVVMNDNALDLIRSAQKRPDKPVYGTTFTDEGNC